MTNESREAIIPEEEFAGLLGERAGGFLCYLDLILNRRSGRLVKRHYVELVERAHEVETLLDDFAARNNKKFAYFTELVASLRGFGRVAVSLTHMMGRYPRYRVLLDAEFASVFLGECDQTARFLNEAVKALVRGTFDEAAIIGLSVPQEARTNGVASDEGVRRLLPHNIDDTDVIDEEQKIAEVATQYLSACDRFKWAGKRRIEGAGELKAYVLKDLDEERARYFEALVHSIQSKYDTYVKSTTLEAKTTNLRRLRGHASVALHLLQIGTELVHFYVRHENDVRNESLKSQIARLVDKTTVLDRAANFAFYYASHVLLAGRPFAEEALSAFIRVQELAAELPENETLHARPISLIVKIVKHHGTHVEMQIGEESCNAASIMEIIMMAGNRPDARKIRFRGGVRPLADIKALFGCGLGEQGLDKLPETLGYLR